VRFAEPIWLFGTALALVVGVLLAVGGVLLVRATRRFGDENLVLGLVTGRPGGRRALKGGLLVAAVALAFLALARPQYGRGTRLIPATNLDVVLVLDYSKSMYARDIVPSRIQRAKSEVARLIGGLPGARFGAVAFAGQPMAFPLTSDGGAIAQFFRQLDPNDMPVGGTAIARALEAGRELFSRDPLSKKHEKVMLLVTDGEDLEGDPVSVANAAALDGISVYVVQIGGRTPEPIPEVNDAGQVIGTRRDAEGRPLTTALTVEGEEQLARVAEVGRGLIVRSQPGTTGIEVVADRLRALMTEELSERVETVYADVFYYPLLLALLLLVAETFVNETPPRPRPATLPPPAVKRRRRSKAKTAASLSTLLVLIGCSGDRSSLFERWSPAVDSAIEALKADDAPKAVTTLTEYLSTGKCENGEIGAPDTLRTFPNAGFDLGLALFRTAERNGRPFGEEPAPAEAQPPQPDPKAEARSQEAECGLRLVRSVGADTSVAPEVRARAFYLAGNLEFLRADYRAAVDAYNAALKLVPGLPGETSDRVGRDAAFNRAIALRRIQEEEEKKPPEDEQQKEQEPKEDQEDQGDEDQKDQQQQEPSDDPGEEEQEPEPSSEQEQDSEQPEPKPEPEPSDQTPEQNQASAPRQDASQDDRILDQLEQAPTLQEHDAKNRALTGRVVGMEDK